MITHACVARIILLRATSISAAISAILGLQKGSDDYIFLIKNADEAERGSSLSAAKQGTFFYAKAKSESGT